MTARPRTLLGFDYGLRRIGVAVGQELTGTASALTTLINSDSGPDWLVITRLIKEWQADALVVGIPLNMDDSEHEMTHAARRFARQLQGRYGLPVYEADERLSSMEAEQVMIAQNIRSPNRKRQQHRARIDREAAQIILQTWLNEQAVTK